MCFGIRFFSFVLFPGLLRAEALRGRCRFLVGNKLNSTVVVFKDQNSKLLGRAPPAWLMCASPPKLFIIILG